jgi:uncharacterized protein (TIGR00255 family)
MSTRPFRSMTGFAVVRHDTAAGELSISLRSVNHRGLDLHFHHLGEFAPFENAMRAILKSGISRGHVEIRVNLLRPAATRGAVYNHDQLTHYMDAYRKAASDFVITSPPDLSTMLALPGVFALPSDPDSLPSDFEATITAGMSDCVRALNLVREREGAELSQALLNDAGAIQRLAEVISHLRESVAGQLRSRLQERILAVVGTEAISPSRLVEEVAFLTDRSDIEEELVRLKLHVRELFTLLEQGGELGKRVDFLLQEMNRETNTILSKTSGATEAALAITTHGLAVKAHIEKIREQALNLE